MFFFRRDVNELFKRIRNLEEVSAVGREHNRNLEELFIKHDRDEMIKYSDIQKRLDSLQKFQYMVFGGFTFFEVLVKFSNFSF